MSKSGDSNVIVVSDAGPLIALAMTKNLTILANLFGKIIVPPFVFGELRVTGSRPGSDELKRAIDIDGWIEVSKPLHVQAGLLRSLDRGEAEAIYLAGKVGAVLLIDESRGRKRAKKEGVKITGTGAILVAAKNKGLIKKVSPVIDELINCGYRISEPLRKRILELAGE